MQNAYATVPSRRDILQVRFKQHGGKTRSVYAQHSDTTTCLWRKIQDKHGFDPVQYQLQFGGKTLYPGPALLSQYNIKGQSTLLLVPRAHGGMNAASASQMVCQRANGE